jgi:hypothetical protein
MGNYVIGVGNYVIATPSDLGNYMSADSRARSCPMRFRWQNTSLCAAGSADSSPVQPNITAALCAFSLTFSVAQRDA